VLAQHAEGAGLVMAEVSASQLRAVRARLPALAHRVL
jgi:hypothetical protein